MIHVCFGLHDKTGRYSKFTGTAMLSMFENHITPPTQHLPSITVHILHDNTLTQDNRDKFSYVAGRYGQRVKFYNVEELCADAIEHIEQNMKNASPYSIGAMYRLLASRIFSSEIKKVIYLDSDIIVNLDISELWRIELYDKILGVIPEIFNSDDILDSFSLCQDGLVKADDYFNSGVLLINLKIFREESNAIFDAIKFLSANPRHVFFVDQDILNYCFSTRTVKLPLKFNRFVLKARAKNELNIAEKIYHFAGMGLYLNINDPFNRLWLKYFAQTPWFDEETIGRLYAGFQQMHIGFKQSMANLTALMSGKRREFFAAPKDVDAFKKIFAIRADEKVIVADNQESLNKLLDAMKRARGKKVFFIMLPNFPFQILIQAGFVPGKDFVNGLEFLSEAQGVPLNSYPLIQAM